MAQDHDTDIDTDSEELFRSQRERADRFKRRIVVGSVIVCLLWVPIALFLYRPDILFNDSEVAETV